MVRQSQPRPYSMAKVGTLTAMCEKIYFQYLLSRKIQTNNDKSYLNIINISVLPIKNLKVLCQLSIANLYGI